LTVAILYIGVEHDPLLGDSAENLLYRSQGAQGKNCIIQKIVLALALACAPMLGAAGTPALADRRIVFDPSKACHATDMSAYVSGTLTGDGVPNNSMSVTCEKAGTMNDWTHPATRVTAAHELGTMNGLKVAQKVSALLQLNSAGKIAMKRYAHLGQRA
jgi:hypothetical protein